MPEPLAFELASRGDRVAGRLWLAVAAGRRPLVLVAPALGASKQARQVVELCAALARSGLAAAAIDLPLQGERASSKLSARLAACAAQQEHTGADRLLWDEFLRQSALDLAGAVEALAARPELDLARLACVAFEPGAEAAASFSARDARVRVFRRVEAPADPAELVRLLHAGLAGDA